MVIVIAVIGKSGSGKTTTIEYLISNLSKEGYGIGTIKNMHAHPFTIDKEGKDTWRYTHAGASAVIGLSPDEIVIIKKRTKTEIKLENLLQFFNDVNLDFVFLEGLHAMIAKRIDIYKIITARDEDELKITLENTVHPILAIAGTVSKTIISKEGIPAIDIHSQGEKLIKIIVDLRNIKKN